MGTVALRWVVVLLALAASAVAGYVHGLRYEQGRQAVRAAEALREREQALLRVLDESRIASRRVASRLDAERAAWARDRRRFERLLEVSRGTHRTADTSPSAGAQQVVEERGCVLSADSVRVWNAALVLGTTAAERAEWSAAADAAAGAATLDDALRNLAENALLLGECRVREQMTQEWICAAGLAACGR